jgi:methylenetetrahydrofolate dehydrogenase (NADP+) / methenyltetrahydrofolate cyclohydrolase
MKTVFYKSRSLAEKIEGELKIVFAKINEKRDGKVVLGIVISGDDQASELFVKKKREMGERLGVEVKVFQAKKWSVEKLVDFLKNLDGKVDGVFYQLPMGEKFLKRQEEILDSIPVEKDVDCLGKKAISRFEKRDLRVVPAVVRAVGWILGDINIANFKNQRVGVVGDRGYMGRMMIKGLKNWGIKSIWGFNRDNFDQLVERKDELDLVISCAGTPGLIKGKMIRKGAVLIDVGTSLVKERVVGDVDVKSVEGRAKLVTSVPGGVGPLTVLALFQNLVNVIPRKQNPRFLNRGGNDSQKHERSEYRAEQNTMAFAICGL